MPDYTTARTEAQRRANISQHDTVILKQGGKHGYPLVYVVRLASINDSDYTLAEIVTPEDKRILVSWDEVKW